MLAPDGGKQFDLMKVYNCQKRNFESFQLLLEQDLYGYLRGFAHVYKFTSVHSGKLISGNRSSKLTKQIT